ncbi:MAG TPA: TetR family transcriptional regulator [Acetobacteraceae bacterium]|nr:TetR family transcriptional regulator [Acetobacteraceae bacterium]
MRKSKEAAAATRQCIIDAAALLFRRHGIDAVGVDAVMQAAGLTHGGFYGHFASKEALVAEVSAAALARSAARWDRISREAPPAEALGRIVGPYLSPAHVAAPESGCVLTALGAEVARRPEARAALSASIREMLQALARCRPEQPGPAALAGLSTMVGAVVLARLADDPQLADAFLQAAERAVLGRPAGETG